MKSRPALAKALCNRRMLICIFNGFTAGLPLYFLYQFLPAWLREGGLDLKTIGFLGLALLPYSFKYLWAPVLDRVVIPFFGRRRGWMLLSQLGLLAVMAGFALLEPASNVQLILFCGLLVGLFSATQDIALDAYRRELLPDEELGLGNAFYTNAYRISAFIPGSLGLILADHLPWSVVFPVIAGFMLVGIVHTLVIREIEEGIDPPKTFAEAVAGPFIDFFRRDGIAQGLLILAFIFCYKFGDVLATALITPFYLDLGFTMSQLGTVAKLTGFWAMVVGGFLGGLIMYRIGINRALWVFGLVQLVTILGFAALNEIGPDLMALGVVVALEYLGVGLGSAALVAFIARCTNKNFTGTQLALLSSVFAIPRSFAGIVAGAMIEGVGPDDGFLYALLGLVQGMGYTQFFVACTLLALPGMVLLPWVAPWRQRGSA